MRWDEMYDQDQWLKGPKIEFKIDAAALFGHHW